MAAGEPIPGAYAFTASLWVAEGPTPWFFLSLPPEVSDEIDERTRGRQGGFGSVRVEVSVGSTTWRTSVFPSREHAAYVLPVKRAVRDAHALTAGAVVPVRLTPVDTAD